ncbi:MAG: cytochrome-c peroxidase, partial [Alphaproteobacteria bacterium]
AIAFGKALFIDRRLSGAEDFSCADCHQPANHFADGLPLTMGQNQLDRNTPTLANLSGLRWYGWSGGNDNLWAQSLRPMLDPREMNASPAVIAARVRAAADLAGAYKVMTGHPSGDDDDETVAVTLAKALAAYQEILVTPRTAFDRYRDGLDSGDAQAIEAYPEAAKRGLNIFAGEGRCSLCHFGPAFSNGEFHDVGRRFFSDEPEASAHQAPSQFVGLNHRNWGEWRVPSLRNVANTAPYMHDGSLAKLEDVVRHYSEIDMERLHTNGESLLRPLRLTEGEITDLVAFLNTLSGGP